VTAPGRSARAAGLRFERDVEVWIAEHLQPGTWTRTNRSGFNGADFRIEGGGVSFSVETKRQREMRLGSWVDQARADAEPDDLALVVHKRRGVADTGASFVTLTLADLARLVAHLEQRNAS
jgi:hypothetical protein